MLITNRVWFSVAGSRRLPFLMDSGMGCVGVRLPIPHPPLLPSAEPSRLAGGEPGSVLFLLECTHNSYVLGLKDS